MAARSLGAAGLRLGLGLGSRARGPGPVSGGTGSGAGNWRLLGAVCLQRSPRVTRAPNRLETDMRRLLQQMEHEKSLYSDHELRVYEDQERIQRRQADDYESDEEEVVGQEIVSAQDLEDSWDQKLKKFRCAERVGDADNGNVRGTLSRKLEDKLILLVRERLGDEDVWLLPQGEWKPGESLRGTAERTLSALSGDRLKARFLGNAPGGWYKYRYPSPLRSSGREGAKVFFFKAMLTDGDLQTDVGAHAWVTAGELRHYLKPQYLKQLNRFVFDI